MSAALDLELMNLSLDEDDTPYVLPDLPEMRSPERNALSLVGRILNVRSQRVASVVRDMPRKWQKVGRVYGIALSQERFQFIFKSEHDLNEILEKGIHTHNQWPLVMERWVEDPPSDYLQYVPIWVQIRNIPINHYTEKAIMNLGEILGEVKIAAFDPFAEQVQDFVRVKIKFNVAHPLRRSKFVQLHM